MQIFNLITLPLACLLLTANALNLEPRQTTSSSISSISSAASVSSSHSASAVSASSVSSKSSSSSSAAAAASSVPANVNSGSGSDGTGPAKPNVSQGERIAAGWLMGAAAVGSTVVAILL